MDSMARPGTQRSASPSSLSPDSTTAGFTAVVRAHSQYVWRLLRGMGVREGDLDDLCQETFLVVHRKLPGFEPHASLRSWIYGIALRVTADYRKRAHRKRETLMAEPPEVSSTRGPAHVLEQQQDWALLDRLMAELTEEQRQVFVLFEIEEVAMQEVSAIVGCPLQTAYSRLHAARKHIAERLHALRTRGEL